VDCCHLLTCLKRTRTFNFVSCFLGKADRACADLLQAVFECLVYSAVSGALHRVTTFLEFLETLKCKGIWLRSGKRPRVREKSGNLCSQVNLIVAALQNNIPVLFSYCNLFFIRDVHGEFG